MTTDKELLTLKMQVKAYQAKEIWESSTQKRVVSLLGLFASALIYLQFLAQENIFIGALVFTLTALILRGIVSRIIFKFWRKKNEQ